MEESFWQARWSEGRIGFHEPAANKKLVDHWCDLNLAPTAHVFVPLCGKTFDLDWLMAQGHRVTGIEFNRNAVEEVFDRLTLTAKVDQVGALTRLQAEGLTLFCGDVFALTAEMLGPVDVIYDRAALVALPSDTRRNYARHLMAISDRAAQLLIGFDYDQSQTNGPPFSTPEPEIRSHYDGDYSLLLLSSVPIVGPLGNRTNGLEQTWLLTPS